MFTKDELSLLKNTFADNDTLLYTIRKVFLQFPLTEVEKHLIQMAVTPEVLRVLRKRILPELSPEYPLGQIPSLLTTLTQQIQAKNYDEMYEQFEAKDLEIRYLEQQFKVLVDFESEQPIRLSAMANLTREPGDSGTMFARVTAYLFLLGYIDPMLNMIRVLAGEKNETPEEQEKRLSKDSTK